ncbi:portal_HK97, phage portal protein, HK97 family [uncultured Caudovirales phage]|uniref:Portal_HK97, phage portal protein, HK97 family n=1 Tax=uncultured Caudovirales phage TaxID=2100421 RepID=A0A6J5KJY0_9CAUD|nr:portal_HK97, phage portal protein, HK97 family [uncultured Caudovirales phage]
MAILDIFRGKKSVTTESNTLFGQTQLGNNVVYQGQGGRQTAGQQLLYVTTSSTTNAGRIVDVSVLSRNSTVMACVGVKARALAQCGISIMYKTDDGTFEDALKFDGVGSRDKIKAKQVANLMKTPNNFESAYEFWYQWSMWQDLLGETFTLWWRAKQDDPMQTPIEMYNLDSTLITTQLTPARYPSYRLSTPSYGFNKDEALASHQVMHIKEAAWQGAAGFNKGILATELVALDQDIDLYANFVMQNGAKPSGLFRTDQVIPDAKYKEIASRLKEAWASMTGSRTTDLSKVGQGMLLDQGMTFETVKMLTLQDADAQALKEQTMKRICGLFGVPPAMIGIADQKYNNTQTMMDEFYKATMYPMIINIEQKLNFHLFKGYPNLCIRFDTKDFLKGAALDQINFASQGVNAGIMTPNEARVYLNMPKIEGADELKQDSKPQDITGSSPQDTGGGGGNQKRKGAIGTT